MVPALRGESHIQPRPGALRILCSAVCFPRLCRSLYARPYDARDNGYSSPLPSPTRGACTGSARGQASPCVTLTQRRTRAATGCSMSASGSSNEPRSVSGEVACLTANDQRPKPILQKHDTMMSHWMVSKQADERRGQPSRSRCVADPTSSPQSSRGVIEVHVRHYRCQ